MITYYFRTVKDDSLKQISEIRNGVWVHAESPTEEEINFLVKELCLDDAILEDAQDFFEVPRLERSDGATYFFTRYPYNDHAEDTDTAPILIVIGEAFVLTLSLREVTQFDPLISGQISVYTTQKTKLFIQMMEVVTQSFERQLTALRKAVHRDRVRLRKISNQEIVRFVNYEHRLNDMVSAILPTNAALRQIMSDNHVQVFEDDRELLGDLRIDNDQIVDSSRTLLKTIQNVRNATEAILTNNLNNRIKTLTVLTILLTIPMVVSSLYGMNIPLPLANSPYAFELVMIIVLGSVSLGVWYFKKNEWF